MKSIHMPAQYALISSQEQTVISGGSTVSDAVSDFIDGIDILDLLFTSSVLFVSFTFMPQLLTNAAKAIYEFGQDIAQSVRDAIGQIPALF